MRRAAVAALAALAVFAGRPVAAAAGAPPPHAVVLVSIDGFRADDFERFPSPHLHALAARGVRALALRPSFPSKTFPNHFTMVTGRWPEHHGIVANDMLDAALGAFRLEDRAAVGDARWWLAEPLWVTAERHGLRSATMFWPGSEAAIGGVRPTWWRPYEKSVPAGERVRQVLAWLTLPPEDRPRFVTLYFEGVDAAGHDHGPFSPEVGAAIATVDAALGGLAEGLASAGLTATTDVVVVSDHGMAATPPERRIVLDDPALGDRARIVIASPLVSLWPAPGELEGIERALARSSPHLAVYRRETLPERWHYRASPRIPPLLALADEGYRVVFASRLKRDGDRGLHGGDHGYDPALPSMSALFVAAGPSFARGRSVRELDNVEVYPLLCAALGMPPLAGDWTLDGLGDLLAEEAARRLSSAPPAAAPR